MAHADPRSAVLDSQDLLGLIMLRVGSSKQMLRCSAVSPHWRAVARGAAFRRMFNERYAATHVGFLVEMSEGIGRITKLMHGDEGEESAVAIRAHMSVAELAGDNVLSSKKGLLLTHREGEGYSTSNPAIFPRVYTKVAEVITGIPRDPAKHTVNTFGQFGVVPKAGRTGMAFFVKDPSRSFLTCYDGVSFCSSASIFVHVCVYDDKLGWDRVVSQPFESPEPALFHRNPYAVLEGTKLYMMYIVGYIICMDTITQKFAKIPLPAEVEEKVDSWYEYTVASHRAGGLVLVHYSKGVLYSWVMSYLEDDVVSWELETEVDLIQGFGPMISWASWQLVIARETYPLGSENFYTVQVRTASDDGRIVLLTLGFNLGLYEVDMLNSTVRPVTSALRTGMLGRMYALSEPWPSSP